MRMHADEQHVGHVVERHAGEDEDGRAPPAALVHLGNEVGSGDVERDPHRERNV